MCAMSDDGNGGDTESELAGLLARHSPHITWDYGCTGQECKILIVSKLMAQHEVPFALPQMDKTRQCSIDWDLSGHKSTA
jgi:hypothetical protein